MTTDIHPLSAAPHPPGPLDGIGVIVTRPLRAAAGFATKIASLGGRPLVWPAIVILPPDDGSQLAQVHANLDGYDIAIFVSPNAVEYGARLDHPWPAHVRAFAPGAGTAEALAAVGVDDVCVPETTWDSEGLLELPDLAQVEGKRVVIFRGEGGREFLGNALRARGAIVDHVPCYRRAAPQTGADGLIEALHDGRAHALTLTSAEGLVNLMNAVGLDGRAYLTALPAFCAHPRIAERARDYDLPAVETAGGDAGLLAGLLDWFVPKSRASGNGRS